MGAKFGETGLLGDLCFERRYILRLKPIILGTYVKFFLGGYTINLISDLFGV